jgi:hypothetical protein
MFAYQNVKFNEKSNFILNLGIWFGNFQLDE